jgi:pimeloyl-ACP methyl ester carboxylesterase
MLERPRHRLVGETHRAGVSQRRLELEVAPALFTPAYVLVPPGSGRRPAVLVVYYDAETSVGLNPKQLLRDFAWQLAGRGFVTLAIGTPAGTAWKPELNGARCQPLAFYAYAAANCWRFLSQQPEVDAQRIGVMGHSYGGKWALFAAAFWEPFACVVVSDPGVVFDEGRPNVNYWEPWYLGWEEGVIRRPGVPSRENPRTGAYRRLVEAGHDLHELQALIAPRPFLVSGGAEDPPARWLALNHAVAVNRVLGFTNRVGLTQRTGHDPTPESNEQIYQFFERFLSTGPGTRGRGGVKD